MTPSELTPSVKNERLFLLTLAGIQFTHILDFMIMMPLGPQLIRAFHLTTHEFGFLLSSYTFTAAVSGVLATTYIDRFDRRHLMLTLYLLFILATFCCGLAPDFYSLLIARGLAGAFGGILSAMVQTMIADVIPFERRGQAMGTVMTAFSISTVAGVPLGLFFANTIPYLGWRAPFFFIVLLSVLFFVIGYRLLPNLTGHIAKTELSNVFANIRKVAVDPHHVIAFAFMSLLMLAGFSVIPYIALYTTLNLGMPEAFITIIYFCGGATTIFTSQLIGKLTDKCGKLKVFQWMACVSFIPLLVTTHLVPVPWWLVLLNSTLFFVLISGRMIPGMAMISAVAEPRVRGTYMSLVSSVQMLASGVATLIAGMVITRGANGQIEHYNIVGYIAVAAGIMAIFLARRLKTKSLSQ